MSTPVFTEIVRFETDPAAEKARARRFMTIAIIATVAAVAGLVMVIIGQPKVWWVLVGLAGVIAVIYFLVAALARKLASLTGDDLIDVAVAREGLRGPGGLNVTWAEIREIDVIGIDLAPVTPDALNRLANATAERGLEGKGFTTKVDIVTVTLRDIEAVRARTTSEMQRNVLDDAEPDGSGTMGVPLGLRTPAELAHFIQVLNATAQNNGVPVKNSPA